jgi:hypothetical protein
MLKSAVALTVIPLVGTIQAYVHLRRGTGRDPHPRARLAVAAAPLGEMICLCIAFAATGKT